MELAIIITNAVETQYRDIETAKNVMRRSEDGCKRQRLQSVSYTHLDVYKRQLYV